MRFSRIPVWFLVAVTAASLLFAAHPAMAQDDPPSRVARLNFSYGTVSFQPAGENDWVAAVVNRPLTSGDSLWVDAGGRAELHVGSTAIRLGENTSLTLLEVSDHVLQFRLAQGSMILNARHVDGDDLLEADAPNLAFTLQAPGEYRVDVNADGTATATSVLRGQGQVTGGGRSYTVVAGQQAQFAGVDSLTYEISEIPEPDRFASWAFDRDRREDRANTANYVSRDMTGYEDLDAHGQWSVAAGYGPVWTPVGVPVGWAPYHYGHWAWIEPWGWTWVDDQPWGFAPFHYGRWAFVGAGWVWVPGPVAVRPIYAPHLVAFIGGGPGGGFALTVGGGPGVAWFPLGPGEVFVPAYRVSPVYVTNVNITNTRVEPGRVTVVYNSYAAGVPREAARVTYVNQQVSGGVTVVSRETFVSARPVGTNIVQVNAAEMARAPVSHMVSVAPVRGSVMGAGAPAASAPPAAIQHRVVVGNRVPPAPQRAFAEREAALNAHPGQPAARSEFAPQVRSQVPPTVRPAPPASAPPAQPAARSESAPPPRSQPAPAAQPAPAGTPPRPPVRYEAEGAPPAPKPAAAPAQPAAQPAPQPAQSHPNAPPAPAVQPKNQPESHEAAPKAQPQQQQKPAPAKTNKPAEKEKEKPKSEKP